MLCMGAGWAPAGPSTPSTTSTFSTCTSSCVSTVPSPFLSSALTSADTSFDCTVCQRPPPSHCPSPAPRRAAPPRPPSRLLHTGTSRDQHAIKPSASQQRRGTAVRESGAWGTSCGTHGVLMGVLHGVLHGLLHGVLTGYFMGYSAALTFKSIPISRKPEYSSDRDSVLGTNPDRTAQRPHAPCAQGHHSLRCSLCPRAARA